MKKISTLFFLGYFFTAFSPLQAGAVRDNDKQLVEQFVKNLDLYYIEPGWVIPELLALPVGSFTQAWAAFVTVLRERPWVFFCKNKSEYSERACRERFIAHCERYKAFLEDLVVDMKTGTLFLTDKRISLYTKQPGVITLFQYWKAKKNKEYQSFYAFYFDRVAANFVEAVSDTYLELENPEYTRLCKKSYSLFRGLLMLFGILREGVYDAVYANHIRRYSEVLQLLSKERTLVQKDIL